MPDQALPVASAALTERYRDNVPVTAVQHALIDSMLAHRSVRAYTDQALAPGTLETLVAAAQSAATSSNLQTWSVVAVEDQARRDRLAVLAGNQKHIREAPLFLCWVADLSRAARAGARAGEEMGALPYFEPFMLAVIDAALAAQNATAAAEALGLGTVYIGGMRNHPEAVAAELALPPGCGVVFGLCVGHPDPARPAMVKPRLPQEAVLHREQYRTEGETAVIAGYDLTLHGFQAEQGMRAQGWSELVVGRLGPVKGLGGREGLRGAIESLGFGLK